MTLGPIVADLAGLEITDEERQLLLHPALGGIILFSRNIHDYQQLQDLVRAIRAVRPELLVAVDQEGGRVQRCKSGFTRIPAMQEFDARYTDDPGSALQLAADCGWLLAAEILAVGIDFSFAPVLDVDQSYCSVIGDRSFSADPERVIALASAFIQGAHEAGMAVTGKHFPGHGSVKGDSHLELPVDNRDLQQVSARDMQPFARLVDDLEAVMPAHILFPKIDPRAPVGFSSHWLGQILRHELGFKGVVFSDDLSMAGAAAAGNYLERVQRALVAGCDMVLLCNNPAATRQVIAELSEDYYYRSPVERSIMRARPGHTRAQLDRSPRWQQTSQSLAALLK